MEESIDILAFLEQVMLENTRSYRDDFQLDIRKLTAAAQAPEAGNRAFYWMSRPCGTWCLNERSVFIQESFEHCAWTAYENEPDTIRAFLVIVSGQEQGRPMGKVSPIDYKSNVLNVEKNALHAETVVLNFADGETVTLPYEQVKGRLRQLKEQYGTIEGFHYTVEDEHKLEALIFSARHPPERKSRRPKRVPQRGPDRREPCRT